MKTDKEYPATHSMSTAWYFVDEDDNVAIFDIDDNGPIPQNVEQDQNVMDLCFSEPQICNDYGRELNFTDEQVLALMDGLWETEIPDDYYWCDDIFQINKNKSDQFFAYLKKIRNRRKKIEIWDNYFLPVCLSEKHGIYMTSLSSYKYGNGFKNQHAKYLFENNIVLRYCHTPNIDNVLYDEEEECYNSGMESRCPYFIYGNDWDPAFPHKRLSVPLKPMKYSQMPEHLKDKVIKLHLKFSDTPEIQLAKEYQCYNTSYPFRELKTPEGVVYTKVYLPSKESIFVLNDEMNVEIREHLGLSIDDISEYIKKFPRFLTEEQVRKLKELPINKECED